MSAIKKNNYSIFIPIVAIWLWDLRNNYLFYNLLQFFDVWDIRHLFYTDFLQRFSAEDYTNMSYYNCCGIRPKHSNISKRGVGVITICVVLDKNTVIFQKRGVLQFVWYWIKIMAMLCFISWFLICRVCSHPRRFS